MWIMLSPWSFELIWCTPNRGHTIQSLLVRIIFCSQWIFLYFKIHTDDNVTALIMFYSEWIVEQLSAHSHKENTFYI